MSFTELFIKRPALTIVLSILIVVVGLISYSNLALSWIPNIQPPVVTIYTYFPGANATLVETQVSTPIENALAGVAGVETIYSNSKQGASFVTLTFKLGHNINAAVEDVRSSLQTISDSLPLTVKQPIVEKADSSGSPIMYLAFSDLHRSEKEVSSYVKRFILPLLQTVDGVATVSTYGEREFAMRVWLDPMKMAAANVTVDDVSKVLSEQNIEVPSGQIRGALRYYSVVTNETLRSVSEFNDLIIREVGGSLVRLKDIGEAVVDAANVDSSFRSNGQSALALAIIPQSTANPLTVADAVKKVFEATVKTLPAGMRGDIIYNQATFIHASIFHVYESLIEAIALVLIVILMFLASWRAALIPIITIPICLLSSFAVLYFFGFTINTITLMAFVLAIGLVVDDAIVMLENITRNIEAGVPPFRAAIKGSKEMVFPVIAMTITLAAVYAPIAFTSGILGSVFREFAVTLAGTVLISGFVALTLSPMMCSRLLTKNSQHNRYSEWVTQFFIRVRLYYVEFLTKVLQKKRWVIGGLAMVGLAGIMVFYFLPAELAPKEDMDSIDISVSASRNSSFHFTDAYAKKLEEIYKKIPEVESYGSAVGFESPSKGYQFLSLVPKNKRKKSADQIAEELNQEVQALPGVKVNVFAPSSPLTWFSESNGSTIYFELMASSNYRTLHEIMQHFKDAAQKYPVFSHLDSKLKWDGEQFEININREKASAMKVPMQTVTNTISTLLAGRNIGHFEYDGKQYPVMMQMNEAALANPQIIQQLYVRNDNNKMVPISDLVTVHETTSPEILPHFDRLRDDVLYAGIAPGYTIGEAIKVLQKVAKEYLPDNAKYSFQGAARDYLDSSGKMQLLFFLALLFIYLVLVAQFESFIDPLTILLTVPFALVGALFMLKLTGCTLNIYSNIGLVTLIGLIAKHGILITEFANQQQAAGLSAEAAVLEAASLRLRPILMTTAAMILGALPLALATGPGAENREQIGWVIVGGLLLGTFCSLIVIPVAYSLLARLKRFDISKEQIDDLERVGEC